MKSQNAAVFKKTREQLQSLHDEIDKLSKKNPDGVLNKFKVNFINEILTKANSCLSEAYLPFKEFRVFSEESIPTNSDVLLILAQYLMAFGQEWSDKNMRSML